jgi:hypothetical protein
MAYQTYFKLADDLIVHLNAAIGTVTDAFITSRYTGLVAVTGTTVYELAIKDIFISFSEKKHKVFGSFAGKHFDRLNGRIKAKELKETHIPRFGDRYVGRYQKLIEKAEKDYLKNHGISILSSYNNVIEWRHQFVHEGKMPHTTTYQEIVQAFEAGKELIHCLNKAMQR